MEEKKGKEKERKWTRNGAKSEENNIVLETQMLLYNNVSTV